jgi:DNA-binding MarR family transcriptional regulator
MTPEEPDRRPSEITARDARPDPSGLLRTLYLLSAAERRLLRRQRAGLDTMSPGRLHLLVHLLDEGEKTNGQLARYAELTPATITLMLDKLAEEGLVERRRDPDDRRVWWVSLTPLGVEETTAVQRQWNRQFALAFADATDDELEAARRILERVVGVYEAI